MNDAYLFVWLTWIFWLITVFFLPHSFIRTVFSSWLLINLISSTILLSFGNHLFVSGTFLTLLLGSLMMYSIQKQWFYNMIVTLILMFFHVTCLLIIKVSPVVTVLPEALMIILLYISVALIFLEYFTEQLTIIILGYCLGEFLYGMILNNLYMFYIIGSYLFLSRLMVIVLMLTIIHLLKQLRYRLLLRSAILRDNKLLTIRTNKYSSLRH